MSIHDDKEPWIVVKPTGKIITAWCSCMTGPSRCCNHIIATLYKVEYANSNNFCSPSCTSMPCGWNQSTKNVTEPKISEIVVRKKLRAKLGENSKTEINWEENRMIELIKFDPRSSCSSFQIYWRVHYSNKIKFNCIGYCNFYFPWRLKWW